MGTHLLRDTDVVGKNDILAAMPDFDLYRLREVVSLRLCQTDVGQGSDEYKYTIDIEVEYEDLRERTIALRFSGLRAAKLPQLAPSFCFGELEIDDVSGDQLEGVRFRARDHGMTEFEVLCKTVAIGWCAPVPNE